MAGASSLAVYAAIRRLSLRGGRTIAGTRPVPVYHGPGGRTIGGISVRPITDRSITRLTTPRFLPPVPPMIGGGYGYGSVFGTGNLPPMYGPYFGGNPYASTPYSAYRPPSNYYFDP